MKFYKSSEYRATKNWPYHVSAGCVVYKKLGNKYEVLLLVRNRESDPLSAGDLSQSFHLPKGTVKINETLEAAALRETLEEAAVNCRIEGYLGHLEGEWEFEIDSVHISKVTHYFVAQFEGETNKEVTEHDGKKWFSINEAKKILGKPNPKNEDKIIERFVEYLEVLEHEA